MVKRSDYDTEEAFERAYLRWRLKENQRLWRLKNEANPIILTEQKDRTMPQTTSLEEAFFHRLSCECGSCLGEGAQFMKQARLATSPVIPAVKSRVSRLPELSDQEQRHLQDASEEVLSRLGSPTA